jgi:hypothetical protein
MRPGLPCKDLVTSIKRIVVTSALPSTMDPSSPRRSAWLCTHGERPEPGLGGCSKWVQDTHISIRYVRSHLNLPCHPICNLLSVICIYCSFGRPPLQGETHSREQVQPLVSVNKQVCDIFWDKFTTPTVPSKLSDRTMKPLGMLDLKSEIRSESETGTSGFHGFM